MVRLNWDENRMVEFGTDRGVLYPRDSRAVAWNGLVSVTEKPSGIGEVAYFIDGVKYVSSVTSEEFQAALEALYYPDEFEDISVFNLSYRTEFGEGHKIHLIYNATIIPLDKSFKTTASTSDLSNFSWDIFTMPVEIPGTKRSAHLVIDTNEASPEAIVALENMLYGTSDEEPTFPSFEELIAIFVDHAILVVEVYEDGSWSATGPEEAVKVYGDGTFEITWPSVVYISTDTYTISTW